MGETVDPITVSVIQHRLVAIVEEMGEAMLRTSYSQILNSSRDFSTAICDAEGRLVAQAEHVPIHVGAIPWAVRSVRQFFGDRVLSNLMFDRKHFGVHFCLQFVQISIAKSFFGRFILIADLSPKSIRCSG